ITSAASPLIFLTEQPNRPIGRRIFSREAARHFCISSRGRTYAAIRVSLRFVYIPYDRQVTISSHSVLFAQSVASGTIEGTVVDSTGAVVVGAMVELRNPITGFEQTAVTDSIGAFRFTNIPFNPYHLQVSQPGFALAAQDVNVRSAVTVPKVTLSVAGISE